MSNRTALLGLALLTLGAGTATHWVAAAQPRTLLPWVALTALAVAWTFRQPRAVDLFEPFTFLSWIHYAPAFVVGSSLLAVGIVGYPYAGLVADPVAACALALVYVVFGYLALGLGCRWRGVTSLGQRLARILPPPRVERTIPLAAILVLVALGLAANYGAFRSGIIGFSIARPPGPLDAAVSYAGVFLSLGHFLFWFRWFDPAQIRPSRFALAIPVLVVAASMVIWGNRGALLSCYLVAALAFRWARGRLTLTQGAAVVALAFVALFVGMSYGSLFRLLKGGETGSPAAAAAAMAAVASPPTKGVAAELAGPASAEPSTPHPEQLPSSTPTRAGEKQPATEAPQPARSDTSTSAPAAASTAAQVAAAESARPSLRRQFAAAAATATTLARHPGAARLEAILAGAGQRLNLVSDVSVTVARYPALRELEAEHGIADLWTMTWTGFVPRALWPAKPRVSDARAYAALYFGWDGNSYATTPPADLIRNVGPHFMPLGMALLGCVLGALRFGLAAPAASGAAERAALYSLLLLSVNLEGSYGLLLPTMLRVGFVALLGLGIVRLWSLRPATHRGPHSVGASPAGPTP